MGLDGLADRAQSEPVELAERIEVSGGKGSVDHVEVYLVGSVGTSMFRRPRRLPRHRLAGPVTGGYTLICEEPLWPR